MGKKKKFWGDAGEFSFRHVKFEKLERNTRYYTDFSEITGMKVIAYRKSADGGNMRSHGKS